MKLLDKKWKWAVAVILLLGAVLLFFYYGLYIYSLWTCCEEPEGGWKTMNMAEMCEKAGGNYIEELTVCQLPMSDAGRVCKSKPQCEGFCEADLSSEEISKIAKGEQVEKTGTCGRWKDFFSGCFYVVENGKVERLCAD